MEIHGNVILKNQIPCLFVRVSLRIFLQGLATNESQHIATSQLRPSHLQLPAVLLEITYQCTATLIKTVKIDIWVLGVFIDGLLCNFKFRSRKLLLQLAPFDVRSGIWKISKTPSLSHPFPGLPLKNIFAAMIARSNVPSSSPHAIWSLGCIHANKLPTKRHTLHNYIPKYLNSCTEILIAHLYVAHHQIWVLWGSNNLFGKDGFTSHQACGCTTPRWWWLLRFVFDLRFIMILRNVLMNCFQFVFIWS